MEPLSRQRILETALAIADADGLDKLTLRALGKRLGVSAMAMYHHVSGKQEIVDGLLDAVIAEYAPAGHEPPAANDPAALDAWLREAFARMHDALRAHPGVLPLLGSSASYGPAALTVVDTVVRLLVEAGATEPQAARRFQRLLSYTVGSAALGAASEGAVTAGAQLPDVTQWPSLMSLGAEVRHLTSRDAFIEGLDALIRAG